MGLKCYNIRFVASQLSPKPIFFVMGLTVEQIYSTVLRNLALQLIFSVILCFNLVVSYSEESMVLGDVFCRDIKVQ